MTEASDALGAADLLRTARDGTGRSPLEVLSAACAGCPGPTVDLRPVGSDGDLLALAVGQALPQPADPTALPLATDAAGVVRAVMCLAGVVELDALFGELRRVLRPTGTLAALLPARPGPLAARRAGWPGLRRALGEHGHPRHRSMRDHPAWLFTSADFAVLTDLRITFHLPLPDPAAADLALTGLTRYGFLSPTAPAAVRNEAESVLRRHAGPTRMFPVPIRLLVGRR